MPKENERDYKAILKKASEGWGREYLYGYVQCLKTHEHINMKKAMELIDFATELDLKKINSHKPIGDTKVTIMRLDKGN